MKRACLLALLFLLLAQVGFAEEIKGTTSYLSGGTMTTFVIGANRATDDYTSAISMCPTTYVIFDKSNALVLHAYSTSNHEDTLGEIEAATSYKIYSASAAERITPGSLEMRFVIDTPENVATPSFLRVFCGAGTASGGSGSGVTEYAYAALPAGPTDGAVVYVNNCFDANCNAGGGTVKIVMYWDGDSWEPVDQTGGLTGLANPLVATLNANGFDIEAVDQLTVNVIDQPPYDAVYYISDPSTACATFTAALQPYMESTAANGQHYLRFVFQLTGANKLVTASHFYDDSGNWPYRACLIAHPSNVSVGGYNGSFPDSLGRINPDAGVVSTTGNAMVVTVDIEGEIEIDQTGQTKQSVLMELGNHYMAGCPDTNADTYCDHHWGSLGGRLRFRGDLNLRNVNDVEGGWTAQGMHAMSKTKRFTDRTETTFVALALNGASYTDMGDFNVKVIGMDKSDIVLHSTSAFGATLPKIDTSQGLNDGTGVVLYSRQRWASPARNWRLNGLQQAIWLGDPVNGGQQIFYQNCDAGDTLITPSTCGDANGVGYREGTFGVNIDGVIIENTVYGGVVVPKPYGGNTIRGVQAESLADGGTAFTGTAFAIGPYFCDGTGTTPLPFGSIVKEPADCAAASGTALSADTGFVDTTAARLELGSTIWMTGDQGYSILLGPRCVAGQRVGLFGPDALSSNDSNDELTISAAIASSGGCQVYAYTGAADGTMTSYYALEDVEIDDDIPDAGDFGNATDLDANGAVKPNSVALGDDTTGNYAGSSTEGGAATTAAALSANGANCPGGQAPLGVDAAGVAETCTDFVEASEVYSATSSGSDPVDGVTACDTLDQITVTGATKKLCVCHDGATDNWACVTLTD